MVIFLIIYILGIIAALWAYYYNLKSGEEVSLLDLSFAIVTSLLSWFTFVLLIILTHEDEIVFTKK